MSDVVSHGMCWVHGQKTEWKPRQIPAGFRICDFGKAMVSGIPYNPEVLSLEDNIQLMEYLDTYLERILK